MSQDRIKSALRSLAGLDPMIPYRYLYRAQVIAQSTASLDRVDVRPVDQSLPEMPGIPLRHGIPGMQVQVEPGCFVIVGWEDGDPTAPFAALWQPGAHVDKLVLSGDHIEVGGSSEAALLGSTTWAALQSLAGAISTYAAAIQQIADPTALATADLATEITQFLATSAKSSKVTVG